MKVKNCTVSQLEQALSTVNQEYGYQLEFNRYPEKNGNFLHFTIQSVKSKIPGARVSWTGINLKSASWHAHGYLFDNILKLAPDAVIQSATSKIYIENGQTIGNWQDVEIGSMVNPCMFSSTSIL